MFWQIVVLALLGPFCDAVQSRLSLLLFDQAMANMRQGMAAGVVQPRDLMEEVLPQLDAVIKPTAEESIFWAPVRNMPEDFPEGGQGAHQRRLQAHDRVPADAGLPCAARLHRHQYLPATRKDRRASAPPTARPGTTEHRAEQPPAPWTPQQIHALAEQRVATLQEPDRRRSSRKTESAARSRRSAQHAHRQELPVPQRPRRCSPATSNCRPRWARACLRCWTRLPKAPLEIRPRWNARPRRQRRRE